VRRRRTRKHGVAFYAPSLGPLLTPAAVPPAGGAETQVFLVSRALAARGVKVCVCTFDIPGGGIPTSRDGVDIAVRQPYVSGGGFGGRLREVLAIRRAIADLDVEAVVTRTASFHVGLVGFFAKLSGCRFVYSSASPSNFDFALLGRAYGLTLRDRVLYRLGLHLADDIVVQTDEQARLCQARLRRAPLIIRNIAEPAPMRNAEPEAFLWVGRAVWHKGPLDYIELARAVPNAKFWMIAVPGPGTEEVSAAIESAASTVSNLELLAPRPRDNLMELVDRAVAIVNTSEFEGTPNATLEGWARGVPALTLAYDPDSLIERYGLGEFAQGSREKFVAAAIRLWEGRYETGAISERCRRYVTSEHSEDAVGAQWLAVLGLTARPRRGLAAIAEVS
jgi:glycosyltransferase involved in cell wall biosynthesis